MIALNRKKTFKAMLAFSLSLLANQAVAADVVEYLHTDALGSPVAVTDVVGNVVERTVYQPYGEVVNRPTTDGPGFTGHVSDELTGLVQMQQRYYDPVLGRFLSADPIAASSNIDAGFNRYLYANNNPYGFIDPDGRAPTSEILYGAGGRGDADATAYSNSDEYSGNSVVQGRRKRSKLNAEIVVKPYQEVDGSGGVERTFGLDSPAAGDGWVVQEVNIDLIGRKSGAVVTSQNQKYWEAFRIYQGDKNATPNDVFHIPSPLGVSPQGTVTIRATARYYEGLILPADFTRGGARQAGNLFSTYNDPHLDFSAASNSVDYTFKLSWP